MSMFDFVSHERFTDDEYTKEAVVLCIEKKHRVTYVRKKMQNGAMFWDVISAAVKVNGEKKYLKSYSQDSNFLHEDIKHYLESRAWEGKGSNSVFSKSSNTENDDAVPF
jgi:hypothetical protein